MSTERPTRDSLVFHCETCSETYEFTKMEDCPMDDDGRPDFRACWDLAREEGWMAFKTSDPKQEWGHLCPACAEK